MTTCVSITIIIGFLNKLSNMQQIVQLLQKFIVMNNTCSSNTGKLLLYFDYFNIQDMK